MEEEKFVFFAIIGQETPICYICNDFSGKFSSAMMVFAFFSVSDAYAVEGFG